MMRRKRERQPNGEERQPGREECQPSGKEGQLDGQEDQLDEQERQPNGREGHPNGQEGQLSGKAPQSRKDFVTNLATQIICAAKAPIQVFLGEGTVTKKDGCDITLIPRGDDSTSTIAWVEWDNERVLFFGQPGISITNVMFKSAFRGISEQFKPVEVVRYTIYVMTRYLTDFSTTYLAKEKILWLRFSRAYHSTLYTVPHKRSRMRSTPSVWRRLTGSRKSRLTKSLNRMTVWRTVWRSFSPIGDRTRPINYSWNIWTDWFGQKTVLHNLFPGFSTNPQLFLSSRSLSKTRKTI